MGRPPRSRAITTYAEYVRRYSPNDQKQRRVQVTHESEDAAVELGRKAVDRAVAQLASTQARPGTAGR